MQSSDKPQDREEKALQALISAALHAKAGDVPLDEIQPYLQGDIKLSAEDEAALASSRKARPTPSDQRAETAESEAMMALHRKRPAEGFSIKTEEEIKRKRQELVEKLRKKKGGN